MVVTQISEVKHRIESGLPCKLLDVRTAAEFESAHAQGATSMPLDRLNCDEIASWIKNSGDPLYILCHSGSRAKAAHSRLETAGIKGAVVVEGGTSAWERAGLPMEYGSNRSISIERQVRIAAGGLVVIGVILSWCVNSWWNALALFVGTGLTFAGITDFCGMAILLGKMPWNRSSHRDRA